jgi:hypothetical protein
VIVLPQKGPVTHTARAPQTGQVEHVAVAPQAEPQPAPARASWNVLRPVGVY